MTEGSSKEEKPQTESVDKETDRPFVPSIIKKPQFKPPKFKYVPPKAGKRHF